MRRLVGLALYGLARRLLGGCPCPLCASVRAQVGPTTGRAAERRAHRAAWRAGRIR
jgi:hypothetical protein